MIGIGEVGYGGVEWWKNGGSGSGRKWSQTDV